MNVQLSSQCLYTKLCYEVNKNNNHVNYISFIYLFLFLFLRLFGFLLLLLKLLTYSLLFQLKLLLENNTKNES